MASQSDLGTEIEIEQNSSEDEDDRECPAVEKRKLDIEKELSKLSLDELKQRMEPITDDGLVLKMVLCEGTGPPITPESILLMHYEACLENTESPFDSTYLRGYPSKHLLNSGILLLGVEKAVATMRKGERSKFWIHCDYAYGPHGCPPRIPKNANVVYDIDVVTFFECREAVEFEKMLPADQKSAPFGKVHAVCLVEHRLGNELSLSKKYDGAARRYSRAVNLLEHAFPDNDREKKTQYDTLSKLYSNLSLCYLKTNQPKRAITVSRKALELDENNVKVLYRMGLALEALGNFREAKKHLLRAKSVNPHRPEVNAALSKLAEKNRRYQAWNKNFCKNMFSSATNE